MIRTYFKGTHFLITIKYAQIALYWPHLQHNKPVKFTYKRALVGKFAVQEFNTRIGDITIVADFLVFLDGMTPF